MDLSKYRAIFIEEATEHLAEMSAALLRLEKDPARTDDINCVMRMAHSIKGMAGTLDYDPITDVAHRLEALMLSVGAAGRFADGGSSRARRVRRRCCRGGRIE